MKNKDLDRIFLIKTTRLNNWIFSVDGINRGKDALRKDLYENELFSEAIKGYKRETYYTVEYHLEYFYKDGKFIRNSHFYIKETTLKDFGRLGLSEEGDCDYNG